LPTSLNFGVFDIRALKTSLKFSKMKKNKKNAEATDVL
jgi:hypothetical protein